MLKSLHRSTMRQGIALLLNMILATACFAQVQPNSTSAGLFINGMTGQFPVQQGEFETAVMNGGPNKIILLFAGPFTNQGISTPAGFLNVNPFLGFVENGINSPLARTDAGGQWMHQYQVPWLAPLGTEVTVQGAVEDPFAPLGFRLTGPATLSVGLTNVQPQHVFFDPTTGAFGVDNGLPPAGSLPGDLPTLDGTGFEGPTAVFFGRDPVHTVFQPPFYCYFCHGGALDIWPAYMGTMMANSARDPLFRGQFSIAVAGMKMLEQANVVENGGELAADFCIRCHSQNAWHSGRSSFTGNGTTSHFAPAILDEQHALDMEGVTCDVCHRATGVVGTRSPSYFATPGQPENGQLVISPSLTKRGPFPGTEAVTFGGTTAYGAHVPPITSTTQPPVAHNPPIQEGTSVSPGHATEHSSIIRQAELCGSCHNVTNPTNGHAVERTYTEWLKSDFGNPASPEFKTCQGCHMPEVTDKRACVLGGSDPVYGEYNKIRGAIRKHEFVGGNAWIPQILKILYPNVDMNWSSGNNYLQSGYYGPPSRNANWDNTTAAAYRMMGTAAQVDLHADEVTPGTIEATVKITNLTGHKLPTGYPEGRQMWINLEARDANGTPFFRTGLLDANSQLIHDPAIKIYEAEHALNYPALGLSGPSFHFILNNVQHKDNRILPKGAIQVRGVGGTDSYDPVSAPWPTGGLYPDGQNWDITPYTIPVPPGTPRPIRVTTTVFFQSTSFEYLNFVANGGDVVSQTIPHPDAVTLRNLWLAGNPAPAMPVGQVGPASTPDPNSPHVNQTALVVIP